MTEKLKKFLDENKQYPFMKDMLVCLEELEHKNEMLEESSHALFRVAEEYANTFQAAKLLIDLVKSYIQKHHISCPESIYQMDKPQVDAIDLVCELCEIVGFIEEDEE